MFMLFLLILLDVLGPWPGHGLALARPWPQQILKKHTNHLKQTNNKKKQNNCKNPKVGVTVLQATGARAYLDKGL